MAKIRLNFGVSDEMIAWIQTQPNIQAIDYGNTRVEIIHNMSGAQINTFRNNFINRLVEETA